MVSRENTVIVAFIALAVLVLALVSEVSTPPTWVGGVIMIGVGVVAPILVNTSLDRRAARE